MKKNLTRILSAVIIIALVICLIPTFSKRMSVEEKNMNVVVSLYYNDIANRLRGKKLDDAIAEFKKIGVTTMSFSEENINSMVARGDVTNIKYNVLRHKFDDESLDLAELIAKEAPDIIYDSQLLITKDPATADFLSETLPHRFIENHEYKKIVSENSDTGIATTVFCIYDGTLPTNDVKLGYNENIIKKYAEEGFDICLIMHLSDSNKTDYINNIDRMVKEYGVKHISIRAATVGPEKETDAKEHYTKITKMISDNDLNLVITENPDQLSNESPFGYKTIFGDNSDKVMRSYETYDASQEDETHYKFRYHQYLNSTIDRNIRFITVSQIHLSNKTYEKCTEYTVLAVKDYIQKVTELGYTVNGEVPNLSYDINLRLPNAISAVIMIFMIYLMISLVFGSHSKNLFIAAIVLSVLGFVVSYFMPDSLCWAFPTAWAVISPCFALTVVLFIIKHTKDSLGTIPLILLSIFALVGIMSVCGIVQSSLLSGIDYYVNNDIFRGIKLSLFLPLLYALVIFVLMMIKIDYKKSLNRLISFKIGEIKLIWIIAVLFLFAVGYSVMNIYITRSGNVNSISSLESSMRNFITDVFKARPRTKEFLVGYPCLTLFVYYLKKTNIKILQGVFFCGAAITAASISNSFCHVFTTVNIIYGRVLNGVILGIVVSLVAYIANLFLVKIVKMLFVKRILPVISKNEELYSMYKFIIGERN